MSQILDPSDRIYGIFDTTPALALGFSSGAKGVEPNGFFKPNPEQNFQESRAKNELEHGATQRWILMGSRTTQNDITLRSSRKLLVFCHPYTLALPAPLPYHLAHSLASCVGRARAQVAHERSKVGDRNDCCELWRPRRPHRPPWPSLLPFRLASTVAANPNLLLRGS